MNKNNNIYILYFSNFCKNCNKFQQELSKSRYNGLFRRVCVDPDPRTKLRPPLPTFLKSVPTIFVKEGKNEKIYTGQGAFRWVTGHLDSNGNPLQPKPKLQHQVDQTGLLTYDQEMSGANSYSLIDGTTTMGSFGILNQDQRIDTPTENDNTDFKKLQTYNPNNMEGMGNMGNIGNIGDMGDMGGGSGNIQKEMVKQNFEALMAQRQAEESALQRGPRPI